MIWQREIVLQPRHHVARRPLGIRGRVRQPIRDDQDELAGEQKDLRAEAASVFKQIEALMPNLAVSRTVREGSLDPMPVIADLHDRSLGVSRLGIGPNSFHVHGKWAFPGALMGEGFFQGSFNN